ncbi:helix-turn-helix domain-containing protein [Rhodococcus qingshengii]|uniref:helix-turn-helix domain-containing protein n=1 Tax=Rhodococcus qingshengii TaxID=334542 RepID=UPI001455DC47|nr:helix-turn-helix domain-containing protein [Rhodococcus qingshengii]
MSLETQLRDAIYKAGRGALENATEPNQKRVLQFLKSQGPQKLEQHLDAAGNAYVNLILPAILPIINEYVLVFEPVTNEPLEGEVTQPRPRALSLEDIREIRTRRQSGESQHDLAQRFNVSQPLISQIVTGRKCKNAGGPIAEPRQYSKSKKEAP